MDDGVDVGDGRRGVAGLQRDDPLLDALREDGHRRDVVGADVARVVVDESVDVCDSIWSTKRRFGRTTVCDEESGHDVEQVVGGDAQIKKFFQIISCL